MKRRCAAPREPARFPHIRLSGYNSLVLGVGQDADLETGRNTGLVVTVFDATSPGGSYCDCYAYPTAYCEKYSR